MICKEADQINRSNATLNYPVSEVEKATHFVLMAKV